MKLRRFNYLAMAAAVVAAYVPIRSLPDRQAMAPALVSLRYQAVDLPTAEMPWRLAGAWEVEADDRRFGGISALAVENGRFLAISDLGAVIWFQRPSAPRPTALIRDLREGPGPVGKKWSRDAESVARDPLGRGWWIGYEQRHSLWLYDRSFGRALKNVGLPRLGWGDNRGTEGLIVREGGLLVLAENGRHAIWLDETGDRPLKLHGGPEVADAARAPDGSGWVLLREKGLGGIRQSIANLRRSHDGYVIGSPMPLPKEAFDNYEGMAIEALDDGRWRFWLITDDGHRVMARTVLVALDLDLPVRHDKSPARRTGLSKNPSVGTP